MKLGNSSRTQGWRCCDRLVVVDGRGARWLCACCRRACQEWVWRGGPTNSMACFLQVSNVSEIHTSLQKALSGNKIQREKKMKVRSTCDVDQKNQKKDGRQRKKLGSSFMVALLYGPSDLVSGRMQEADSLTRERTLSVVTGHAGSVPGRRGQLWKGQNPRIYD